MCVYVCSRILMSSPPPFDSQTNTHTIDLSHDQCSHRPTRLTHHSKTAIVESTRHTHLAHQMLQQLELDSGCAAPVEPDVRLWASHGVSRIPLPLVHIASLTHQTTKSSSSKPLRSLASTDGVILNLYTAQVCSATERERRDREREEREG